VDGSFNVEGSGARVVLTNPEGHDYTYEVRFEFSATNNVVEYEAFSARLGLVEALYAYPLQVYRDFQLIIGQCQKLHKARESTMLKYLKKFKKYLSKKDEGKEITITHIPREANHYVDFLSRLASYNLAELHSDICEWRSLRNRPSYPW
jgi:ribonuclease HI